MGDICGDIFGDFFGGGRSAYGRSSNGPMRGANLRTGVRITFEEAIFGCEKEDVYKRQVLTHIRYV